MTRTHKVGWLFRQVSKKGPQKLGDFFEDKSLDFGSTSSRGCLCMYHSLCMFLHALSSAMVAQ